MQSLTARLTVYLLLAFGGLLGGFGCIIAAATMHSTDKDFEAHTALVDAKVTKIASGVRRSAGRNVTTYYIHYAFSLPQGGRYVGYTPVSKNTHRYKQVGVMIPVQYRTDNPDMNRVDPAIEREEGDVSSIGWLGAVLLMLGLFGAQRSLALYRENKDYFDAPTGS